MGNDNQSSELSQQAPLPWMTGEIIRETVKLRPQGLSLISLGICLSDSLSLVFLLPKHVHSVEWIVFWIIQRLIDFWIIWYLWRGRNWARLLVVIGSVITLFGFTLLPKETPVHQVYTTATILFSIYLLYWFSRKPILRFLKAPGNGVSKLALGAES